MTSLCSTYNKLVYNWTHKSGIKSYQIRVDIKSYQIRVDIKSYQIRVYIKSYQIRVDIQSYQRRTLFTTICSCTLGHEHLLNKVFTNKWTSFKLALKTNTVVVLTKALTSGLSAPYGGTRPRLRAAQAHMWSSTSIFVAFGQPSCGEVTNADDSE